MDSESSSTYLLNHADLSSFYYQSNDENGGIIDLGLSLRVLQPQVFNHSVTDGYGDLVEWHSQFTDSNVNEHPRKHGGGVGGTKNVVMVKTKSQPSGFVKVNMDGVFVGRKICIRDHSDYLSLAFGLEEMFGRQSLCGLRLFQNDSDFSLLYKVEDEQWRSVGDIPWKEFLDCVKRLRIMCKYDINFSSTTSLV